MALDLNTKKVIRNAYRITSKRPVTCLRIRVPGGHFAARHLAVVQRIAEEFGNGSVHITIRQGFEIPGIPFERMPEVNRALKTLIDEVEIAAGVEIEQREGGYPAAGTRNISACIGNRVCQFANYDTTALAKRLEREVFPNHYHVKIALTGCPNDCIKAHLQDFGIIGQADVGLDPQRCVGCEACAKNCQLRVTGAITMRNNRAVRDPRRCIGCGECVLKCPTNAWTRNPQKYYRLVIMGRTGKKNPRLAATFIEWTTEEAIVAIIRNTYAFIDQHIDRSLPKEHVGYIVDRVGYQRFREAVLSGVELGAKAVVAENLLYAGYWYERDKALIQGTGTTLSAGKSN
ncbi:MAG: sulfite reductase subunit C [Candidatus Vecturithrix sp.]|jgi:anaerobic sulfite reductase subunit C|nr:sulfite reductase subunit C [Candidatus Vecturithrix sp.]